MPPFSATVAHFIAPLRTGYVQKTKGWAQKVNEFAYNFVLVGYKHNEYRFIMEKRRADEVREALEHLIFTGEFASGDRLDEVTLAARFNVSRTPLREALHALAASGFVEQRPGRGAFVRHPSFPELVEMFEVMAELEGFCGRLAARRISDAELTALKHSAKACELARAGGDTDDYYWKNEEFHRLLYQASGNDFLAMEAQRLHRRLQPFRRLQLRARGRMKQSMDEHRAILKALEDGDPVQAERELRNHVTVQGERFTDLMASMTRADSAARKPATRSAVRG